jgi:hypothetical protein
MLREGLSHNLAKQGVVVDDDYPGYARHVLSQPRLSCNSIY